MFESESSPTIATLFVTSPSRRTTSHSHGPLHLLYILWSLKYFTCTPGTLIALQLSYHLGCSFPVKCRFVYAAWLALLRLPYQRCRQKLRKQTNISQESYSPVDRSGIGSLL